MAADARDRVARAACACHACVNSRRSRRRLCHPKASANQLRRAHPVAGARVHCGGCSSRLSARAVLRVLVHSVCCNVVATAAAAKNCAPVNRLKSLAVPRGLEPPTFGLGNRCSGPKPYRPLPPSPDLSTFFGTAIPADAAPCHPIPYNWVAIWVATSS